MMKARKLGGIFSPGEASPYAGGQVLPKQGQKVKIEVKGVGVVGTGSILHVGRKPIHPTKVSGHAELDVHIKF